MLKIHYRKLTDQEIAAFEIKKAKFFYHLGRTIFYSTIIGGLLYFINEVVYYHNMALANYILGTLLAH